MKRRTFLKQMIAQGAAACFPAILPASALGLNGTVAPSNRIALGFIGLGYEGKLKNLRVFMAQPEVQVVALCDVFEKRLRGAHLAMQSYSLKPSAHEFETCFTTRDWREVVARSDVDAVVISTPDHWHALPAIAAAKAGKDVFCEKPLSLTIREGRVLSDVMQQRQRIFQTASEARASIKFLKACEWVRNGRIGKLHTIRVAIYGGFAQGGSPMNINPKPKPVPEGFDYDMWLGQAPEAFYTPVRYTKYRYILDYSGGNLTDWGSHIFNVAQWGNDSDRTGPVSVEGTGRFASDGLFNVATEWNLTYEYANGVKLNCVSGDYHVRFEGSDGWIQTDGDALDASNPDILRSEIGPGEIRLRTCLEGEHRDFLNCVVSREPTFCPAETGHRAVTLGHLGNIALMTGRKLKWNPEAEVFDNDEEANRKISRTMRSPWTLES